MCAYQKWTTINGKNAAQFECTLPASTAWPISTYHALGVDFKDNSEDCTRFNPNPLPYQPFTPNFTPTPTPSPTPTPTLIPGPTSGGGGQGSGGGNGNGNGNTQQPPIPYSDCTNGLGSNGEVLTLACIPIFVENIINFGLDLAGMVCLIVIIISGIRLIVARGDQKAIVTGKNTLIYAIVGLVLILCSFIILNLIGVLTGLQCITQLNGDFANCHL